jgi:hypothetical protein
MWEIIKIIALKKTLVEAVYIYLRSKGLEPL